MLNQKVGNAARSCRHQRRLAAQVGQGVPLRQPQPLVATPGSSCSPVAMHAGQSYQQADVRCAAVASTAPPASTDATMQRPLKVLIAGAGIGGLVLGVALLKKGFDVEIYERDLTAIRGEGKYRGPIQIQSNALAALEAIDADVAEQVMQAGCITGDRINGLCDGATGDWYVKFDTFHPAVSRGLPVTRVINRTQLQEILYNTITHRLGGRGTVRQHAHVVGVESETVDPSTGRSQAALVFQDGSRAYGDLVIGADGIWSKVRQALVGPTTPHFSGYTCYTGISDFTPADIDVVGYRVFLGNGQYFVSSDVGNGKMQWYGFHREPAGGSDAAGTRKARLLKIFGHWCDNVVDLIQATPEEDILRRDIYDRPPILKWHEGRVALLGDSAHAMQPNLGQGGCMAIEDAYELGQLLAGGWAAAGRAAGAVDVPGLLRDYQGKRMLRVSAIHGMAGMAAFMASTYKSYLGEGFGPVLEPLLTQHLKILHPGRLAGQAMMKLTMPGVLAWVLGGNTSDLAASRAPSCRLSDTPKGFDLHKFEELLHDDELVTRTAHADWLLVPAATDARARTQVASISGSHTCEGGLILGDEPLVVGRSREGGAGMVVPQPHVSPQHAKAWRHDGRYWLEDQGSDRGTWINGRQLIPHIPYQLSPGDVVEFGQHPCPLAFRVKMQHVTLRKPEQMPGHHHDAAAARAATMAAAAAGAASAAATATKGPAKRQQLVVS